MRRTKSIAFAIASLATVAMMGVSVPASAQADKDVMADKANTRRPIVQPQGYNRPGYNRPGYNRPGYGRPVYHDGPGAGPEHSFYRGGRLPGDYRSRQYVVDDWRAHHLRQPPRGYHWVQTGGDYVLVAIATGIIADILLNQ
jgi:Ni/Co efflux regulator RcnB